MIDRIDTKLEPSHLQRNAAEFETIKRIAAGPEDGPVMMLNMNGYYPEAGYPDGELYQRYITGLRPFLDGAGGLLLCQIPVYGQAVGQQRVDELVFAWYPTHRTFADLYLAPGAEENFRLKGLCVQHHVIHRCPGDRFPLYPHAEPADGLHGRGT